MDQFNQALNKLADDVAGTQKDASASTRDAQPAMASPPEAEFIPRAPLGGVAGGDMAPAQLYPGRKESPAQQLSEIRNSLGWSQKVLFNLDVGAVKRDHALRMAKVLFSAALDEFSQKAALGLDISKKHLFVEYMRQTERIRAELQRLSAKAESEIADQFLTLTDHVYSLRKKGTETISRRLASGLITPQEAEGDHEQNRRICSELAAGQLETMKALWANHRALLGQAISLHFREWTQTGAGA